jgi:hypothetical protein
MYDELGQPLAVEESHRLRARVEPRQFACLSRNTSRTRPPKSSGPMLERKLNEQWSTRWPKTGQALDLHECAPLSQPQRQSLGRRMGRLSAIKKLGQRRVTDAQEREGQVVHSRRSQALPARRGPCAHLCGARGE